ncbi:MAG: hypothetical protein ACRD2M_07370, partial [Terriglobales bacterium]
TELFEFRVAPAEICVFDVNFEAQAVFNSEAVEGYLSKLRFGDLERLFVSNEPRNKSLTVLDYGAHCENLYEVSLVVPTSFDVVGLMRDVVAASTIAKVVYGYGRTLAGGVDPSTEQKIKRSLFGTESISVAPVSVEWMVPPSKREQMMKGVYAYNLIADEKFGVSGFGDLLNRGVGRVLERVSGLSVIKLSTEELKSLQMEKQELCAFVRP